MIYPATFIRNKFPEWKKWTREIVAVVLFLMGTWTLQFKEYLPTMKLYGNVTPLALTINLTAGFLFIAATGKLLLDFHRSDKLELYFLAAIALFLGLSRFTFHASTLWAFQWWWWHLLRILAFLIGSVFMFIDHRFLVTDLFSTLKEKEETEKELYRTSRELEIKNKISEVFLTVADDNMYSEVLNIVLDAMNSKYGLFGYINKDDGSVVYPSLTSEVFDRCRIKERPAVFPRKAWGGLWGRSLVERKTLYSNKIYKVPEGHISITRSISTPIVYRNKLIGHIHVANKPTDYVETDRIVMDKIARHIAPVLNARLQREEKEKERQNILKSLWEEKNFRDNLVETAQTIILLLDLDGRIKYFNSYMEELSGYKLREVQGQDWFSVFLPNCDRDNIRKLFLRAIKDIRTRGNINPILTKEGKERLIEWHDKTLKDANGNNVGLVAVGQDITELEQTHMQLLHSEKLSAIGKLSASIAHEFGNPIYGIRNVLEGLRENVSLAETDKALLDMAITECYRIGELLRNLQDFNRPSSGIISPVDIHECIDGVLLFYGKELATRNIEVKKQYDSDMPTFLGIPDQIKQVILNLLNNADEAIPQKGGRIRISTEHTDREIVFHISDSGIGIKPEDKDRIFEPFFTTKSAVKGTGLGLSVAYGIIKSHKGRITVESKTNKGTTFSIILPIKGDKK
jgi:PAS domain S-box-containing protein